MADTTKVAEHTPGPWRVEYDSDLVDEYRVEWWPWRILGADGEPITTLNGTSEADAALLAAAPSMLAALKAVSAAASVLSYYLRDKELLAALNAAIAKAEGRETEG